MNNYRPISLLPVFSKIFEKCIAKRLISFFERCSILCKNQYGFRRELSTVDAIIECSEFICANIEQHKHVISVFIDYSKAFDTINHEILLDKLELYGIRDVALSLFRSYLSGRRQCVRVGESLSGYNHLTVGVPQGSVLGPILFITYINDFPKVSPALNSVLFADDTTVSAAHLNFVDLCNFVNVELVKINEWSKANKLFLNSSKTAAMIFSNRPHDVDIRCELKIDDICISYLDDCKFLGLSLDTDLKFKNHIAAVCNKLSKIVGILFRVSRYLSRKSLVCLYYALFYPYLTYCNVLWGGTCGVYLNTVEMLQKRAIRVVTHSEFLAHTDPLFHTTGILKICDIHKYLLMLYFFKNRDKFEYPSSEYSTRYSSDPILIMHRLTLTERTVHYSAAKLWRSLPVHLKNIQSYNSFKSSLKAYYLDKYISASL